MRDVPCEDIFTLSASAAASESYEWIQVEMDVHIPYCTYQVKSHSSPWFLTICATAIVHRIFFCLHQQNKFSESKVKFRQACNRCKRVLEAAKLAYANKTKESITSQKIGFWSSASDKTKLLAKNVSKNFNLYDLGISLPAFPSRTNLKLHNISTTPKIYIYIDI